MFEEARPMLLALALGLLIGIERERAKLDAPYHAPLGSRTFALLGLLGALAASVEDTGVRAVLALFAIVAVLAGYLRTQLNKEESKLGLTTETAAVVTFVIGYLGVGEPRIAIMLAVLVLLVLALKPRIHAFARAGITEKEVRAALTLMVLAFVVLPLLPDRPIDPWKLVNPARVWLMFVLVASISFGAYVAVRALGSRRGLSLAGFLSGLVSSTAATLSFARRARTEGAPVRATGVGIVLANAASVVAQFAIVMVIDPGLAPRAAGIVLAPCVVGLLLASPVALVGPFPGKEGEPDLDSPLDLRSAALFGGGIALALAALTGASRWFGGDGVLVTSALGGAANVQIVTMGNASLAANGTISDRLALFGIVCAFQANMVVKLAIVAVAARRWRLAALVAPPLLAMMAASIAAFLYLAPEA